MKNTNVILKIEESTGDSYECECCGTCIPEKFLVYVNDNIVWEKDFDGHMGGYVTEDSILNTVLNHYFEIKKEEIENQFTEEARLVWSIQHPGNYVSSTEQTWKEYKQEHILIWNKNFKEIADACKTEYFPCKEINQLKMIALWINEVTGEEVIVVD